MLKDLAELFFFVTKRLFNDKNQLTKQIEILHRGEGSTYDTLIAEYFYAENGERIRTKNYPLFSMDNSKDSIKKADTIIKYGHHELSVDTTWVVNGREVKHVYYDQKNRWAHMTITSHNEKETRLK